MFWGESLHLAGYDTDVNNLYLAWESTFLIIVIWFLHVDNE